MQERCSTTLGRAPLPERAGPFALDADVTQISPMAAAARCSVGRRLERGTNDAAANLADPPVHTKMLPEVRERPEDEHGRGQRHDQTSWPESILRRHFGFHGQGLGFFVFCPYNVRLQPRRLTTAGSAVGCKPC